MATYTTLHVDPYAAKVSETNELKVAAIKLL